MGGGNKLGRAGPSDRPHPAPLLANEATETHNRELLDPFNIESSGFEQSQLNGVYMCILSIATVIRLPSLPVGAGRFEFLRCESAHDSFGCGHPQLASPTLATASDIPIRIPPMQNMRRTVADRTGNSPVRVRRVLQLGYDFGFGCHAFAISPPVPRAVAERRRVF